ncbi:putative Gnk2-like domain-containing protein [Helianthus annuus]|nr:putative Gnk2-like domain-containing protein [Helianthus annuus]KAJ0656427.1 putative Gnk2-like domain-containing protein [Helianthus annuus]
MIVLFAVIQGRVYCIERVKEAVLDVVTDASRSSEYFGWVQMLVGSRNKSVYVLAECWRTLSPNSCCECLDNKKNSC